MIAHLIRNRTIAFHAILKLQTERRWCLTGTPVQNSLDDFFALTEFLRFHPVEDRCKARRWVLDPLGTQDEHALENLRLLVETVALRRTIGSEMSRARSDAVVTVPLSDTERRNYESIRNEARKMSVSVRKSATSHRLLYYILQMRQLCSHGLIGQTPVSNASGLLTPRPTCNKCSENLPPDLSLGLPPVKSDELIFCLECAAEEDSVLDVTGDPSNLNQGQRSTTRQAGTIVQEDTSDEDIDMDAYDTTQLTAESSSKIQSVIDNIVALDQQRHEDSSPVKR